MRKQNIRDHGVALVVGASRVIRAVTVYMTHTYTLEICSSSWFIARNNVTQVDNGIKGKRFHFWLLIGGR